MLVPVVAIGNSKGIRIPKTVLDQLHILDKVDMEIDNQQIVLKPVKNKPRSGWEIAFKKMHEENDDTILIPESFEQGGFEWEW